MVIIVSKNNKDARKVNQTNIKEEAYLQKYIHENPDTIPVYEIDENKRLLVVSSHEKEFPTNSGRIDALAIDQDGELYIIETKLYKNSDKRKVIAQVLDYGAALWKHSYSFTSFLELINERINLKFGVSLEDKIIDFYGINEDDVDDLLNSLMLNLERGNFKFIVLMDQLDDRLKDLIHYVNENSRFDIYPVELEFYKFDQYEVIIPKIYGTEIKKRLTTSTSSSGRVKWTEETFIEKLKVDQKDAFTEQIDLFNYLKNNSDGLRYGTGKQTASYTPYIHELSETQFPFSVRSDGKVLLKFSWERFRRLFGEDMETMADFIISILNDEKIDDYPKTQILEKETRITINDFVEGTESIKKLFNKIKEMTSNIRVHTKKEES